MIPSRISARPVIVIYAEIASNNSADTIGRCETVSPLTFPFLCDGEKGGFEIWLCVRTTKDSFDFGFEELWGIGTDCRFLLWGSCV